MGLILRRVAASFVNGFVILLVLGAFYHFIAFILWFFVPMKSHLSMDVFSILFVGLYSYCGNMNIGWVPALGGRIAKISLQETTVALKKPAKVVVRLVLYYLSPLILIFVAQSPLRLFHGDPSEMPFLSSILIYLATLATLMIPISVIVGGGHQGLHDALSGLSITGTNRSDAVKRIPFRSLLTRTFIVATIASIVVTFGALKLSIALNAHKSMLSWATNGPEKKRVEQAVAEFDSIITITPKNLRSYDVAEGFRWWVDLTTDIPERVRLNRKIGLKGVDQLDLLGYGFSIKTLTESINLINANRDAKNTLTAGTKVFSVFLFYDAAAFSSREIASVITGYFRKYVNATPVASWADVIRVKAARIVKVGFVKIGYYDEWYMIDNTEYWRDENTVTIPVVADMDRGYLLDKSLISTRDLK